MRKLKNNSNAVAKTTKKALKTSTKTSVMMTPTKVTNILSLRDDLITVYNGLRNNEIAVKEAKEFANISGKILGSAKLQLEYNAYMKNERAIKFLDSSER